MNKIYRDYQLMYLILQSIYEESPTEGLFEYLDDANPYLTKGENSADPAIYIDFKEKYDKYVEHSDYSYEFILSYLKNIDYYKGLDESLLLISREEYIETCKDVMDNQSELIELVE